MKPAISEKIVTGQVIPWLRILGWRCIRIQSGLLATADGRRVRVGEKSIPDWICIRGSRYFMLELKAPGKTPSEAQAKWFAEAERDHLSVIWADSLDMLIRKYEEGEYRAA